MLKGQPGVSPGQWHLPWPVEGAVIKLARMATGLPFLASGPHRTNEPHGAGALLLDRNNFGPHRNWCLVFVLGTLGAIGWYAAESLGTNQWPSGASWPGLTCGIMAGLLMVFEFLLWPRKTLLRAWRIGRTQTWLRAHIWLGLLTIPLVAVHAWRELGGPLTMALVVLFVIVIVSGIWGLVLQNILPRAMLMETPKETIYTQIPQVIAKYRNEAEALVRTVCDQFRSAANRSIAPAREQAATATLDPPGNAAALVLEQSFSKTIAPFLSATMLRNSVLADRERACGFFERLRDRLDPAVHPAIDQIEEWCENRRQFARQARLHFWLHNWLWVHLPLSAALIVLLAIHVCVAIQFM